MLLRAGRSSLLASGMRQALFSSSAGPRRVDASKLTITTTSSPKPKQPEESLIFGRSFSDHMLEVKWSKDKGWAAPTITPYHPLVLDPASVVFHYAAEIFEGMKAYVDKEGHVRLFRPDRNMARLNKSAARLALPTFDGDQLLQCIKKLVLTDKDWIPRRRGYSLYIRPTLIGTAPYLGVGPSGEALLYVILSPVGPYYRTGFAPVTLFASSKYVRAWPGGTGEAKCGGNYAPGILPQMQAQEKGFSQILWLFGDNDNITEVGTMNFFLHWINERTGKEELITPPLDGTILEGVTRASIIDLARKEGINVVEAPFTMKDVVRALEQGRVLEAFGAGTAAIVSPIKGVNYKDKFYVIPLGGKDKEAKGTIGPVAERMANTILGIQYGEIPSPWSVRID